MLAGAPYGYPVAAVPTLPAYNYGYAPAPQYGLPGAVAMPPRQYLMNPEAIPQAPGPHDYVIRVPMPEDESPVLPTDPPLMVPQAPPKRLTRPPQRYEVYNPRDEMPEPPPDYHGEIVYPSGDTLSTEVLELEEEILIEEPRAPPPVKPKAEDFFDRAQKIKRSTKLDSQPISEYRLRREDMLQEQLHDSINNREQEAVERIGQRVAEMLVTPKKQTKPVTEVYQIPRRYFTGEKPKQPEFIAMQVTSDGKLAPLGANVQQMTGVQKLPDMQKLTAGGVAQFVQGQGQIKGPVQAALPSTVLQMAPKQQVLGPSRYITAPQHQVNPGNIIGQVQPEHTEVNIVSYGKPQITALPAAGLHTSGSRPLTSVPVASASAVSVRGQV